MRDRVVRERRLAEVSGRQVLEVEPVADGKRLVEPVVVLERGHRGGVAGRLLPEVRRRRVARDDLREHEHDERDADREEHERDEPPQQEAREAG